MEKSSQLEPIAIVGIGCRYPGGVTDNNALWDLLQSGKDCFATIPSDRWDNRKFFDSEIGKIGKICQNKCAFLDQRFDLFDASYFGLSAKEAEVLDPQQRLLLEVTLEAIEDAGLRLDAIGKSNLGVFIGGFHIDHTLLKMSSFNRFLMDGHVALGIGLTMLSSKISHFLDARGPCFTVDTACSSSLVALHYGCKSLWDNSCSIALVGGVNVILSPYPAMCLSSGRFISSDGKSKTFSSEADGYGRGEAAAIVVLKKYSDAIASGDLIHALIRSTGINHDGRTPTITQPNAQAQKLLLSTVYNSAGIHPKEVDCIEAHGTGTSVGDRLEMKALIELFKGERNYPLYVGSIKTNIGHTEAAAGISGLIKAVLMLKHRQVLPSLYSAHLNQKIRWKEANIIVPQTLCTVNKSPDIPMYCGVSSFGYGGTNVHVLLESIQQPNNGPEKTESILPRCNSKQPFVVPFSAKTWSSLRMIAKKYSDFLVTNQIEFHNFCHTLALRRTHYTLRTAIIADSIEECRNQLTVFFAESGVHTRAEYQIRPKLLFVYSGSGFKGCLVQELLETEPVFRSVFNRCIDTICRVQNLPVSKVSLDIQNPTKCINSTNFVQIIAYTELLKSWGIIPSGTIGYSIGEIASAWCSGLITLEDGLFISYKLDQLTNQIPGEWGMVLAEIPEYRAKSLESLLENKVSVSIINDRNTVVFYGQKIHLTKLESMLDAENISTRRFDSFHPYHSNAVDKIKGEYLDICSNILIRKPNVENFSSVFGKKNLDLTINASYWWNLIRNTNRFGDALSEACRFGYNMFMEIGAHPGLRNSIYNVAAASGIDSAVILPGYNNKMDTRRCILDSVKSLYTAGIDLNWARLVPSPGRFERIPTYAWDREFYWQESQDSIEHRCGRRNAHSLLQTKSNTPLPTWESELNSGYFPYIKDHCIRGNPVFPAAGFIEGALFLAKEVYKSPQTIIIDDMRFHRMLVRDASKIQILSTYFDPGSKMFGVASRFAGEQDAHFVHHVRGVITGNNQIDPCIVINVEDVRQNSPDVIEIEPLYTRLQTYGITYGPLMRSIIEICCGKSIALATMENPASSDQDPDIPHPSIIDGAFQTLAALINNEEAEIFEVVPTYIARIILWGRSPTKVTVITHVIRRTNSSVEANFAFCDSSGKLFGKIYSARFEKIEKRPVPAYKKPILYCMVDGRPEFRNPSVHQGAIIPLPLRLTQLTNRDTYSCMLATFANFLKNASAERNFIISVFQNDSVFFGEMALRSAIFKGFLRSYRWEISEKRLDYVESEKQFDISEYYPAAHDSEWKFFKDSNTISKVEPAKHVPGYRLAKTSEVCVFAVKPLEEVFLFSTYPLPKVGPDNVLVKISNIGIHGPRQTGIFPHDDLNLCASGIVVSVGSQCKNLTAGDHVVVSRLGQITSHMVSESAMVFKCPPKVKLNEVVCAFSFVWSYYALAIKANLKKGEYLLVVDPTSNLGLSAFQIGKFIGANVVAIVKNDDERKYLHSIGLNHILDNNVVTLKESVLDVTNQQGIDVVIGANEIDVMHEYLFLLRNNGRFIKTTNNIDQYLPTYNKVIDFISIDQYMYLDEHSTDFVIILRKILDLFSENKLVPLPTTIFPASQIKEAFTYMAQAKHIGKVVIDMKDQMVPVEKQLRGDVIKPESTYLVTGGTSGFGLETAKWLVDNGAQSIVLLSRSGAKTDEARAGVVYMQERGAQVEVVCGDVSNRARVKEIIDDISARLPTLRGIIHAAAVLDDKLIVNMDEESFRKVLAPKVDGAMNLHETTLGHPLDFFVCYSSIVSLIGNPGQANYAAANAFLDAFAHWRRGQGLPGTAINWGAIGDTGMVARDDQVRDSLLRNGIRLLPVKDALEALGWALLDDVTQWGVFDIDWEEWARMNPRMAALPMFEKVIGSKGGAALTARQKEVVDAIAGIEDSDQRLDRIMAEMKKEISHVLKMPTEKIEGRQALNSIGVDSLMGMELAGRLQKELGVELTTFEIMKGITVAQLAEKLDKKLGEITGSN